MNLRQLMIVDAAIREGSLRKAAQAMNTSQPALSKSLHDLEAELGVTLFERSITGVTPTEYGKILAVHTSAIFKEIQFAHDEINAVKNSVIRQVSFSISPTFTVSTVPNIVIKFNKKFPGINLKISNTLIPDALTDLRNGALDFVLGTTPNSNTKGINFEYLTSAEVAIIAQKNNPLVARKPLSLSDLRESRWLTAGSREYLNSIYRKANFALPNCHVDCESLMSMIAMIACSNAIGFVPKSYLETDFFPNIRALNVDLSHVKRDLGIITRQNSALTEPIRFLLREVRKIYTKPQ